jgi:hypothetical protein
MTRKEFIAKASSAKVGDKVKVCRARAWEIFVGWTDHYWNEYTFLSFENNEAVFQNNSDSDRKIYVGYREIKTGQAKIIWSESDVFTVNKPLDLEKDKVIKLFEPGVIQNYK